MILNIEISSISSVYTLEKLYAFAKEHLCVKPSQLLYQLNYGLALFAAINKINSLLIDRLIERNAGLEMQGNDERTSLPYAAKSSKFFNFISFEFN